MPAIRTERTTQTLLASLYLKVKGMWLDGTIYIYIYIIILSIAHVSIHRIDGRVQLQDDAEGVFRPSRVVEHPPTVSPRTKWMGVTELSRTQKVVVIV